jgi:hypothetical protein
MPPTAQPIDERSATLGRGRLTNRADEAIRQSCRINRTIEDGDSAKQLHPPFISQIEVLRVIASR